MPFALAGSYALGARRAGEHPRRRPGGGGGTVEQAVDSLAGGFRIERPPEDWLFKAYLDDAMVDVLHRLNGVPVADGLLRAEVRRCSACGSRCSRPPM